MTLRELRYLVAVAETGHFGRAAELCHVTQPTLSTQLKKLEDYLGVTLIERNSKSVCLTASGKQVVARARIILDEADELLKLTRIKAGPLSGPLNLGIIPTLSPYFLPLLIPQLRESYPRLQLVVHEDLTPHLLDKLKAYQIDTALLALPLENEDLETLPLFDEPFFFACPPDHPLANASAVTEQDLRREHLLLLTDGHCLRGQALAVCGVEEESNSKDEMGDFRATSLETLCQLVSAGMGTTLLPALAARQPALAEPRFVVRPIRSQRAHRRIGLVWRRGCPRVEDYRLLGALISRRPPEGTYRVVIDARSRAVAAEQRLAVT